MKLKNIYSITIFTLILGVTASGQDKRPIYNADTWENPEWENPEIYQINREEPTATFYNYPNIEAALLAQDWRDSPYYISLNGTWHFYYADSVQARPTEFYKDGFSTRGWDQIEVHSN